LALKNLDYFVWIWCLIYYCEVMSIVTSHAC